MSRKVLFDRDGNEITLGDVCSPEDIMWDRMQAEKRQREEAAAKARGDYIPTPRERLVMTGALWTAQMNGHPAVEAVFVRDGVARLTEHVPADAFAEVDYVEAVERDGVTWVKITGDPFPGL